MLRKVIKITMSQLYKVDQHMQVSLKDEANRHGARIMYAIFEENTQLDDKTIFNSQYINRLSKKAKYLLTMVKEKRDGKIKGRICTDSMKEQKYIANENVASHSVQLESLVLVLLIDAHDGKDVATVDVMGVYLLANMKDFVLVKLTRGAVDILCEVNKRYLPFVTIVKCTKVLYMRLTNALYGCMQSVVFWYKTFDGCLKWMGYKLNTYAPCVVNKTISSKQCTIIWRTDDNTMLRMDPSVVDDVINK